MVWTDKSGAKVLEADGKQWKLIQKVELSMFYDDGSGYIDLGLDNLYSLIKTAIRRRKMGRHVVCLKRPDCPITSATAVSDGNNYSITGRIPALLDGNQLVNIILRFTNEDPTARSSASARFTAATLRQRFSERSRRSTTLPGRRNARLHLRLLWQLRRYLVNDKLCFGSQMTLSASEKITVSNVAVSGTDACNATYRLTDVYNNYFWTPSLNTGAD